VLHELLERLKLGPGGDVVASTVQLADLVVFDVVSLDIVPVLDGEGVGPWNRDEPMSAIVCKRCRATNMEQLNS